MCYTILWVYSIVIVQNYQIVKHGLRKMYHASNINHFDDLLTLLQEEVLEAQLVHIWDKQLDL